MPLPSDPTIEQMEAASVEELDAWVARRRADAEREHTSRGICRELRRRRLYSRCVTIGQAALLGMQVFALMEFITGIGLLFAVICGAMAGTVVGYVTTRD